MQDSRQLFSGSGSPEAVVTAPAGSWYLDETAGAFYSKAKGSAATGWAVKAIVSGALAADVTGNLTGNVTGNVTGNADTATLASGSQETCTARATDTSAPITQKVGTVLLSKGSAGAWTLAAPTATTDDGKVLTFIGTTAFAHTVTTPSNKLNGSKTTVTFAAVGDSVILEAYQGIWYSRALNGALIS